MLIRWRLGQVTAPATIQGGGMRMAGTTALDAITYLDKAINGRRASELGSRISCHTWGRAS